VIYRDQNRIFFAGTFTIGDLLASLATLHQAVQAGYERITLDFGACIAAFAGPVLAICAQAMKLRGSDVSFEVVLPRHPELAKLFRNANWAHFLAPEQNPPSQFRGFTQVPATHFTDATEQLQAVNRIVNGILGAIPDLDRRELAALEWSVNEITDNVLVHSQS